MSESEEESYQTIQHWGEIVDEVVEDNATYFCVLEDIKRSMQHNCLNAYPDDENIMKVADIKIPPGDPLVLYAIELHKWMSKMKEIIAKGCKSRGKASTEDDKISIPEMPNVYNFILNRSNSKPAKLSKKSNATAAEFPELSDAIVKQMLPKCVAVMAAHIGLEDSFQSVIDVLVDALEQFLIKICDRLTSAYRENEDLGTIGFPNLIERVLIEMGFGGAKGLHNFYVSRVVKYVVTLEKRCKKIEKVYLALRTPKAKAPPEVIEKGLGARHQSVAMDTNLDSGSSEDEITLHSSKYFKDSETVDMIID